MKKNSIEIEKKVFEMSYVKRSMILIGAPVAVFFIITAIIVASLVSNFTEQQAYRLMYSNMRECVLSFEKTLAPPAKVVESLSFLFSNGFYKSESQNEKVFDDVSQIYPEFPGFYGAKIDGTMYAGSNILIPEGYDPSSEIWFTGAIDYGGELYFSPVYTNKLTDSLVVTISKVVYKDEEVDGVVAFFVVVCLLVEELERRVIL